MIYRLVLVVFLVLAVVGLFILLFMLLLGAFDNNLNGGIF